MTTTLQLRSTPREVAESVVEIIDESEADGPHGIEICGQFVPVVGAFNLEQIAVDVRRGIERLIENERSK